MTYVIITETSWGHEVRKDIKGTISLEKFTDSRIVAIFGKKAKAIYKLYTDSSCVQIAQEGENGNRNKKRN